MRLLFSCLFLAGLLGCATSATDPAQIAKRRNERASAFSALSATQQDLVNRGLIQVGMGEDAVYIAWGKPAQILRRGDASGEETIWLYTGSTTDQYVNWNYVETRGPDGVRYLDRVVTREYAFNDYISARLVFRGGKVTQWEMMPSPGNRTLISPNPAVY